MPVGYLFTLAVVGASTILALTRIRRFGNVLFMFALPAGELPHLALLFLLLSTALAWEEGGLGGIAGAALLAVAALVAAGLVELLRRALRARAVVAAMARAHGQQTGGTRWWWLRPLLFPFPWRPRSVIRLGPIGYGENRRQRLDIYRPRNAAAPGPVLVYFHGGGYSSGGNRREARALLHRLAARGWICVSATYRLRPQFGFEDHLADARAVLAWAHANPHVHGGDTGRVAIAGSSAGGHLTALCALTQDRTAAGRPRVDAAVSLYPYVGRYYGRGEDESPASTALALDASQAPPFFLVHGDHDSYVPVEDARSLHRHLAEGSAKPVWYAELPGAQHGFDAYASWRFSAVIDGIEAFLDQALDSGAITGPPAGRTAEQPGRASGDARSRGAGR